MLFHTFEFAALLALVLPLHWLAGRFAGRIGQNTLLLLASYVFYGWWDVRFLGLLWISTVAWSSLRCCKSRCCPPFSLSWRTEWR